MPTIHASMAVWPLGPSGNVLKKPLPNSNPAQVFCPTAGMPYFEETAGTLSMVWQRMGQLGAAISSHRVLPSLVAEKESRIVGPICNPVEVVGIARTCLDIRVRRTPLPAFGSNPARTGAVVFGPRLRTIGDHVLVIGSQKRKVQFDDLLPFLFVSGNAHTAGPSDTNSLQILGTHDPANAAGGVGIGVYHHRHGNQILTCLTDSSHRSLRSHLLVDFNRGPPYALPPEVAGILDFHLSIHQSGAIPDGQPCLR